MYRGALLASFVMLAAACETPVPLNFPNQSRPMDPVAPTRAGLRFNVEPAVVRRGTTVTLLLSNQTSHQIGYNLCDSGLEQWQGRFWHHVAVEGVCTRELRVLASGQVAQYEKRLPTNIPAGHFRYRTGIEGPLNRGTPGLDRIASEPFTVMR